MVRRIIKGKRREFFKRMAQLLCRHFERSRGIFFVAVERIVAQSSKRRFGIICQLSGPLEKGRAEGAGWMCLGEAPFYAAVSMTTAQSATPYRHFERSEKSLSFAVSRSMLGNSKRETCYPLTFGHRPIYMAAKLPPQP